MADYLMSDEGSEQLVKTIREGIEKARQENYAFITSSLTAKYYVNRLPCSLETIGEPFAQRSFGFALPIVSPYREAFENHMLQLQESGYLEYLEEKWWRGDEECWNISTVENHGQQMSELYVYRPRQINLEMFFGPLMLLVAGLVLSGMIAGVEILYFKYKGRVSLTVE